MIAEVIFTVYPLCGDSPESVCHLFFTCDSESSVWNKSFSYLGLQIVLPRDHSLLFECLFTLGDRVKAREGWQ